MRTERISRWRTVLIPTLAVGLAAIAKGSTTDATATPPAPRATVVSAREAPPYGSVLVVGAGSSLAGYPLYEISSDAHGVFGCTTRTVIGFDFGAGEMRPMTCTGPESDIANDVFGDEWPALTTSGPPVAGPGVERRLLGSIQRKGIGRQVTYGGHPLYLFDPPSSPFVPAGEGILESVAPLGPWHGLWDLVAVDNGRPAPGDARVETETLPDGTTALAAEEFANADRLATELQYDWDVPTAGPMTGTAVTLYSFSGDKARKSECTGRCAVTWIPLLTTGSPRVAMGVAAQDVGVETRTDGTEQVTYRGKPLYLYSGEQVIFHRPGEGPQPSITVGNGNGLAGPANGAEI
jgi:predicted lipoprotein with Yx(FWY)xxD motif